ncbi:MAG: MFS transporter [Elusimicrobiales bacterium]|jgi:MFS family permease
MLKKTVAYFSEFKVLKTASRDFWLTNAIQFMDGLAYFSMINIITLYLSLNCGFNDMQSGAWVGIFTLYITAFVLGVGSICDAIGMRKSFFIAAGSLCLARGGMGLAPMFLKGAALQYTVMSLILLLSFGTAFMVTAIPVGVRRFTTKDNRSTGFNVYYLLMNVGAVLAGFAVTDGFRNWLGEVKGNLAILVFGGVMAACCYFASTFIDEHNYADESERTHVDLTRRPLAIFREVWKESAFLKLIMFLALTLGVRLVFTNQFLIMPKYYTRVMHSDFALGLANSINPVIIVVGLILLIPVIQRFSTFKLIVVGMSVSAVSLLFMAVPARWMIGLPGVHNLSQAYLFVIVAQIVVFAFGELIFSPRFTEYISVVAPKEKVASYMGLSALPMFIAKPINGFISGILVSGYCYDGIRAKIDSGNIAYGHSPEFMWMLYLIAAVLSPVAVLAMRHVLNAERPQPKHEVHDIPESISSEPDQAMEGSADRH